MKLTATRIRLETLTRDLLRNWDETKLAWKDIKAQEFEQHYLVELAERLDKTSTMLEKLDALIAQVRADCE
jgi:hypothetical protein